MNSYPKNSAIHRATAEGYQSTGHVSRGAWDKDKVLAHVAEYKVMGNKVRVLLKREVTSFRDRTDTNSYWALYVKYSEEYLALKKAEREANDLSRRKNALRRMADECTLDELAYMLTYKTTHLLHTAEEEIKP